MTATFRRSTTFTAAPDEVVAVITSHEFLVARHRLQGAAAARPRDEVREPRRLVQVVEVDEYARTLTGTDRGRTERAVTTYEWDLAARRCRWQYRGAHGDRVRVGGEFRVSGATAGCDLEAEFQVGVDYPLVGRVIEKRVLADIQQGLEPFDRLVREALAAHGAAGR
jgi:hypothetical protein